MVPAVSVLVMRVLVPAPVRVLEEEWGKFELPKIEEDARPSWTLHVPWKRRVCAHGVAASRGA